MVQRSCAKFPDGIQDEPNCKRLVIMGISVSSKGGKKEGVFKKMLREKINERQYVPNTGHKTRRVIFFFFLSFFTVL